MIDLSLLTYVVVVMVLENIVSILAHQWGL
jgi:hypothetical protein